MGTDFSQDPQEVESAPSIQTKPEVHEDEARSYLPYLQPLPPRSRDRRVRDSYGSGGGYGGYGGGYGGQYSYYPVPFGYGGYGGQQFGGGAGNGGFFALIGLLFIILLLFSGVFNFTSTST